MLIKIFLFIIICLLIDIYGQLKEINERERENE